jgi:hypothetical protein
MGGAKSNYGVLTDPSVHSISLILPTCSVRITLGTPRLAWFVWLVEITLGSSGTRTFLLRVFSLGFNRVTRKHLGLAEPFQRFLRLCQAARLAMAFARRWHPSGILW